jgi:glycine/D-amino acid oxidase-like deaminating enzyme
LNSPGKSDVVVIGGGVIGCAVAYYLAKRGARVTVVERSEVGNGSSAANTGSINMATKKPGAALALGMASQRLYSGLAQELGRDIEYTVTGKLIVAENETELAYIEDLCAGQRAAGAPVEIVSAARCRELNCLLEGRVLAGLYCATDAQANPFLVTQAFADAARNRGVRIMTDTAVHAIETAGNRVSRIITSNGALPADWVVNAAGPHAAAIGDMVGVAHDVRPWRGQLVVLEANDDLPEVGVSGASQMLSKHAAGAPDAAHSALKAALYYSRRPFSGTVLLGSTYEFAGYDIRTTHEGVAGICRSTTRAMPRLGRYHAVRSWAGLRPYSPTGPMLGHAGQPDGYMVATGHGGDGMALAPITGLYLAELIARDGRNCELSAFLGNLEPSTASAAA